jgi:hypothetical protein
MIQHKLPSSIGNFFDTMRRSMLWALGQINRTQNWLTPSERLPGLRAIEQALRRTSEHEMVKLARPHWPYLGGCVRFPFPSSQRIWQ